MDEKEQARRPWSSTCEIHLLSFDCGSKRLSMSLRLGMYDVLYVLTVVFVFHQVRIGCIGIVLYTTAWCCCLLLDSSLSADIADCSCFLSLSLFLGLVYAMSLISSKFLRSLVAGDTHSTHISHVLDAATRRSRYILHCNITHPFFLCETLLYVQVHVQGMYYKPYSSTVPLSPLSSFTYCSDVDS